MNSPSTNQPFNGMEDAPKTVGDASALAGGAMTSNAKALEVQARKVDWLFLAKSAVAASLCLAVCVFSLTFAVTFGIEAAKHVF
jgi:hypothetical protein